MFLKFTTFIIIMLSFCQSALADRYSDYIDKYADMAIEQQSRYGIPASVTLAQGLLESAAGQSTLALRGNNHFGIKCHKEWTGDTILRDDDAPGECFRVYNSVTESFDDHSRFLLRKRYNPLFELDITDYAAWANGLSKCGYATDPNYASRLIAIIERYALYSFDTNAGRHAEETAGFIVEMLRSSHPVRRYRSLHYVIAAPGDTYGSIAAELQLPVEKLIAFNDAADDCEIKAWEEVYLQPKFSTGPDDVKNATIGEDESLHSVAQRFAMTIESIRRLNPDAIDRPGTKLRLH